MPFDSMPLPTPAETANPVADILRAARARIEDPARWTKEDAGNGWNRFCTVTAVTSVPQTGGEQVSEALKHLTASCPMYRSGVRLARDIIKHNEDHSTTHADILALFDRAITAAEARS